MLYILGIFAADYWIGLKERDDPWDSVTEWVDGSDVVVSNWAGGEPKPGILGCVAAQGTFSEEEVRANGTSMIVRPESLHCAKDREKASKWRVRHRDRMLMDVPVDG